MVGGPRPTFLAAVCVWGWGGGESQPADVNEKLLCSINFQMALNNSKPRTIQSMESQTHKVILWRLHTWLGSETSSKPASGMTCFDIENCASVNCQQLAGHSSACSSHLNRNRSVGLRCSLSISNQCFSLQGTGQCQRHCWLSQLGGGAIDTMGGGQGCCYTLWSPQDGPQPRIIHLTC